jgi:hypothetical protein
LVCGGVDEKGVAEVYYQLGQAQRNLSEVFWNEIFFIFIRKLFKKA